MRNLVLLWTLVLSTVFSACTNKSESYYNLGVKYYYDMDYANALENLNEAIEADSMNKYAYTFRGRVRFALKDLKLALDDHNKALKIDSKFVIAYMNIGEEKLSQNDYRGAIAMYNKVIELSPNDITSYINRGISKNQIGQKDSGCLDFSKAGEIQLMQGDSGNWAYSLIHKYCN